MFEFIKNIFRQKTFKEMKQTYRQEKRKTMTKYKVTIEAIEGLENELKSEKILDDLLEHISGCIRVGQVNCPTLAICDYKQLLEIGSQEQIERANNRIRTFLDKPLQQDFWNKVKQLKEYKVWLSKKKIKDLEGDFQ